MNRSLVKLDKTFWPIFVSYIGPLIKVILLHIDCKSAFLVEQVPHIDRKTTFQRPDLRLHFVLPGTEVVALLDAVPALADLR